MYPSSALFEAASRKSESLTNHLTRSTKKEMLEAAREIGVDWIWEQMILPAL